MMLLPLSLELARSRLRQGMADAVFDDPSELQRQRDTGHTMRESYQMIALCRLISCLG